MESYLSGEKTFVKH
ncbi:DUF5951 family protein, partial [Klebsiella pneumoniae subsp. pneumoniae]